MHKKYFFLISVFFIVASCTQNSTYTSSEKANVMSAQFKEYWYNGKAELSSYQLHQARYGEIHEGSAVVVFVTEDFSKKKLVKLNNTTNSGADRVPILKMNLTKKFITGLYPYSIMQSVFTPIHLSQFPKTLKTTFSSQEWCGHVFSQIELDHNSYKIIGHSYFESEGEMNIKIQPDFLEDEIWTRIRIAPTTLPTGEINVLPSLSYLRLSHEKHQVYKANTELKSNDSSSIYTISYPELERTLTIEFSSQFPYTIQSWQEKYPSGWGENRALLTTTATLKKQIMSDYWNKNKLSDTILRNQLELE